MDAKISGGRRKFYNAEPSVGAGEKKNLEWDLNEWKWDGHQFVATPLNAVPSDCRNKQVVTVLETNSSSSCSEGTDCGVIGKEKEGLEKRRKILAVENNELCDEDGSLSLRLGGNNYPVVEGELENNGRKVKLLGGNSSRSVCQVDDCGDDLNNAKDYHRRHKVCEMHAKAGWAMVGSVMQRFCQQCSRFHLLQEFDEGKRSCRRRLAGHNRRRRKTHPETGAIGSSLTDDRASSYLLISLLKLLTNLHSDKSDKSKDQDLLSHLLGNITSLAGSSDSRNISGLLQASQALHPAGTSAGTPSEAANILLQNGIAENELSKHLLLSHSKVRTTETQGSPLRSTVPDTTVKMPSQINVLEASPVEAVQKVPLQCSQPAKDGPICSLQHMLPVESSKTRAKINDFDLNSTYNETDCGGGHEQQPSANWGNAVPSCPSWMIKDSHQSSPPQTSGNSESSSVHSLSSSNEDVHSRTERIVFKLFGKDPNDFPLVLRAQILDWLSHSPTDIESYIRPGCIVLTVYLRVAESIWEELNRDLCSSLNRLLSTSSDNFWKTGWIYATVQHRVAFIYNGNVVFDVAPLLLAPSNNCKILSVTPIAVALSSRVNFTVKGSNLSQSTTRLLCAFEGKYLVTETANYLVDAADSRMQCERHQLFDLSCSFPDAKGRGFIEVEDHGLSIGSFPFIVAEEEVCREIRMLEDAINVASCDENSEEKKQAVKFLNEMGWLLQKSHLKSRSKQSNSRFDLLSLKRFRWLITFAMNQEWCAVVKKLLDSLFQGVVELGGHSPSELASSENLLHIAVQKKCRSMVKFLVRYKPVMASTETNTDCFMFRPDMCGPSNITALHVAATISGAESVLEALIDDPGQCGTKAWKSARDDSGFTPEEYALARDQQSYILLVQKKTYNTVEKGHVFLNIPSDLSTSNAAPNKQDGDSKYSKLTIFNTEKSISNQIQRPSCTLCDRQQRLSSRSLVSRSLLYRPVMLSMVGIAAVCVCVGLLFKGPPEVRYVYPPFTWESLGYGTS